MDFEMAACGYVEKRLTGWGRYLTASGKVYRPEDLVSVRDIIAAVRNGNSRCDPSAGRETPAPATVRSELEPVGGESGEDVGLAPPPDEAAPARGSHVLGRGLARSYGDASFVGSGSHILTTRLNRLLDFDESAGRLTCEAGTTIKEIIEVFLPRGWFPPVTPGTRLVTLGGAFACDVHGKNHHVDGSISNFVDSVKLLTASGDCLTASREANADLFYATAGGMGLTGLILEVSLRLLPVETSYIRLRRRKCATLDETIEEMIGTQDDHRYSVCWIDCLAGGRALGRSIMLLGNHVRQDELPSALNRNALDIHSRNALRVPADMPQWLLNSATVGAFNSLYYAFNPRRAETLVSYHPFFYPLDALADWNRLYGKRGFVQYQFVIPEEAGREGMRRVLQFTSSKRLGSFLAVLKRLKNEPGPLAFPMQGYTLAMDLPATAGILESLKHLDAIIADLGGRVYLAKDALLSPQFFRKMYPRFPEWLEVKRRYDPDNLFSSALAKRLKLFDE